MIKAGDVITWKGYDWVVLDTECNGGVLLLMNKFWDELPFDENNSAKWSTSTLRSTLIEKLLPELGEENLIDHETDMCSDDGDDQYGTVTDKVFILSADEYRKYRRCKVMPLYDDWWWLCTPWYINPHTGRAWNPRLVGYGGCVGYGGYAYNAGGAVPACIVKSGIL